MPASRPGRLLPVLMGLQLGCQGSAPITAPPPAPPARPNLLLLTVDTQRADRMGAYGAARDTTPGFDAVAAEGALFERVYAQRGSTWPSLASISSSQQPARHGVRRNGQPMDAATPTLATVLRAQGYRSAAVLTNAAEAGWQGFDELVPIEDEPRDVLAADHAIAWLEEQGAQPFFLWVHLVAPHAPYQPDPAYRRFEDPAYEGPVDGAWPSTTRLAFSPEPIAAADREQLLALYDGELAWSDAQLGRIVEALRGEGRLDETLVVLSADHGEELLDRQGYAFHNASVYEGTLRIPLALRLPGAVPAGRHPQLCASLDIAPTLLELLGVSAPPSFEGRSLVPLLRGQGLTERPVLSELEDTILSLRTPTWRYIHNPRGYAPPLAPGGHLEQAGLDPDAVRNWLEIAPEELYELATDPLEQRDLAPGGHPRIEPLRQLTQALALQAGWQLEGAPAPSPLDPQLRAQLEAMGYVLP